MEEIGNEILVRNYGITKMILRFYILSSLSITHIGEGSKFMVRKYNPNDLI